MAVHSKEEILPNLDDQVFGNSFLPHPLPKYKFPVRETDPAAAYQLVHDELLLDGNSRQNVATFCQTWVEPEVRKLMDECIDKNMIDKDEYPQMAELEARCVHMIADLWNAPDAANTIGCSTTGSSEMVQEAETGAPVAHQAQSHLRAIADLLAKIRSLLRCGLAGDSLRGQTVADDSRRSDQALRRKYHRGRADTWCHLHAAVRAGESCLSGTGRS